MCVNSPLYRRRLLLRRQPLYFRERDLSRRRFISLLHSGGKEELTDAFLTIQGWLIPCKIEPLTLQDKLLTTNHPVCCEIPGYTFGSGATSDRSQAWFAGLSSFSFSLSLSFQAWNPVSDAFGEFAPTFTGAEIAPSPRSLARFIHIRAHEYGSV